MADNNLARSRNDLPDFFADGDPLAELARIVGYDDLPVVARPPAAASPAIRHEPAFNLEDELLREFERYDAPRLDPANDLALDDVPRLGIASPPALFEPSVFEQDAPDELKDETFDLGPAEPGSLDQNDSHALSLHLDGEPEVYGELPFVSDVAPEISVAGPAVDAAYAPSAEIDSADEFDLAAELESSIGAEPVSVANSHVVPNVVEVQPETAPEPRSKADVPGFRMPLANFNLSRGSAPLAPAVVPANEPKFDLPVLEDLPTAKPATAPVAWVFDAPAIPQHVASAAAEPPPKIETAPPMAVPAAPAPAPVSVSSVVSGPAFSDKDQFSSLDELIYDVQRYSLPTGGASAAAVSWAQPSSPPPIAAAMVASPAAAAAAVAVAAAPPAAQKDFEEFSLNEQDPFSDAEFELSLSELELDLADIVVEETASKPATPAPSPFYAAQPSAPVSSPAAADVRPEAAVEEAVADLPFDPSQIADSEDQVEAIADLDVPSLPVEEPDEPQAYRPDYDLDIDAELASLLMTPEKAETAKVSQYKADPAPTVSFASYDMPPNSRRASSYSDLDDFERALEEDFRRSLSAALTPVEDDERYTGTDYAATVETARRSVRSWTMPLVIAGMVVLGGVGVYSWLGSGVPGVASSGEPVVIAADKDPVKVAPENPGGKTVPNQDKAVYDRVAGVASTESRQPALISSNEEPVDVVQKTLMPDTLPLEGENDIEPTDIGDTEDARLLPQDQQQQAAVTAEQPVSVMPRKVKTMIVRPDGSLVEQEVPAPALAVPEIAKVPAAGTRTAAIESISQPLASGTAQAGIVPVAEPAPAAGVAVSRAAQVVPAAAVSEPAAPVAPPAASAPSPRAPVPASRPAEQPVNVVAAVTDQGNVRAMAPAVSAQPAAAPAEVASLGEYVIQIASLPSQADAQRSYQNLSSKFGGVIGGRGVDIRAAEIAGKGTFYRVRIPAGSRNDAVALSEKYRAAGGSCLVAR